jgi:hypothetical protein
MAFWKANLNNYKPYKFRRKQSYCPKVMPVQNSYTQFWTAANPLFTKLFITFGSLRISSWVMTFWKANKKIYTSSKIHSIPTRIVHVGEVRSLYSSSWVVADPSSLTQAQNPHKCSELSKITTQRSAISQ